MKSLTSDAREAFAALGFTAAETEVYLALLQESPATAYRVSQRTGRPVANTYKAMASLQRKGAVVVDDAATRLCQAVPPAELLAARDRAFQAHRAKIRSLLESITPSADDERVYRLSAPDQVLQRARQLLQETRDIVLADIFPGPYRLLADALVACARRGVRVVVKVYDDAATPGLELVRARDPALALAAWPGQQLSLVGDASAHLLVLFDQDLEKVHQGVASRSAFLSCMHHNHIANEIRFTAMLGHARERASDALADLSLLASEPPGLRALRRQLAPGRTAPAKVAARAARPRNRSRRTS